MLQREFRIGADEALYVRSAWELDNLMEHYRREEAAGGD